eukprot:2460162-Rhodomonas_salina.2
MSVPGITQHRWKGWAFTWIDPEPDTLVAGPTHALLGHEVALEVAPQLPRGHSRSAIAQHRLHKVLRAGGRGRRAAHEVGVGSVADLLVAEDVLVHAAEERHRRVLGRAVCLQSLGDVESGVASVRVVGVCGHVLGVLPSHGVLDLIDVWLRARVDVNHEHVFEEDLKVVVLAVCFVQVENQRHKTILERLCSSRELLAIIHGLPALEAWGAVRLSADDDARDHALR